MRPTEPRKLGSLVAAAMTAALALSGCAGAHKKPLPPTVPVPRTEEPVTMPGGIEETPPPAATKAPGPYGPVPTQVTPATVILGPGMARGLAHVGVLQALEDQGVPVGMVIGVESGGLMAALYGVSRNKNDVDWNLQRIKEDFFFGEGLSLSKIFGGAGASTEHLFQKLSQLFGRQTFASTRIPIRLGVYSELDNHFELIGKGRLAGALRVVLADRTIYTAGEWFGAPSWSSGAVTPFPVDEARKIRQAPVIAVDVAASGGEESVDGEAKEKYGRSMARSIAAGQTALKSADLVLTPDLQGVGYFDFEKRGKAVYAGRAVVESRIAEIRQVVGQGGGTP
ncbi:MAG TPA: patatin-like phospholipase family protein [Bdellovibrionota bacterium]|jgi:NTE family protein|nr:patatin-like phospholipase family protein [Bdellovibrionota bacterium]